MKDRAGQEINYGDLFIKYDTWYSRFAFGVYKRQTGVSHQYYKLTGAPALVEKVVEKVAYDLGVRKKDIHGDIMGKGWTIDWMLPHSNFSVLKVTEDQLPEIQRKQYNQIKELINGNTGS